MSKKGHKRRWHKLIVKATLVFLIMVISINIFNYIVDPRNGSGFYLSEKNRILTYSSPPHWLGDGEDYDVYQFSDEEIKKVVSKIEGMDRWMDCPVDDTTAKLIGRWRHFMEDEPTVQKLMEDASLNELLPTVNKGYYLLVDRSIEESEASKAKYGLRNYSIFLLDVENNRLYYIGVDM